MRNLERHYVRVADEHSGRATYIKPITVSVGKACEILGLGRNSLYKLLNSKTIKHVKSGSRTPIPFEEVEKHISRMAIQRMVKANRMKMLERRSLSYGILDKGFDDL